MAGFTKAQLTEKAANIKQYAWCRRCRLYWSRRSFAKHQHGSQASDVVKVEMPLTQRPRKGAVAIINPAYERLVDALAELLVKDLLAHPPTSLDDRKMRPRRSTKSARGDKPEYDVLTVDEAVHRLGFSRSEIMAAFERASETRSIPVEVQLK